MPISNECHYLMVIPDRAQSHYLTMNSIIASPFELSNSLSRKTFNPVNNCNVLYDEYIWSILFSWGWSKIESLLWCHLCCHKTLIANSGAATLWSATNNFSINLVIFMYMRIQPERRTHFKAIMVYSARMLFPLMDGQC